MASKKKTKKYKKYSRTLLKNDKYSKFRALPFGPKSAPNKAFYFGKRFRTRRARLIFSRSRSNFFFTLTDLAYKVIISLSTGRVAIKPRKKVLSPYAVELLVPKLLLHIRHYKIKRLCLILKTYAARHTYTLINLLKKNRVKPYKVLQRAPVAHNGVRPQKTPRK